jgi:hypothetical protein
MAEQEVGVGAWFDDGSGFRSADLPVSISDFPLPAAAVVEVPTGFLAAMNDYESSVPRLWHSTDGQSWVAMSSSGLDQPADVLAMAASGSVVVAVGALRTGEDPSQGPFEPVIWHTRDLESWTMVRPEMGAGLEGVVQEVVATSTGFLPLGRVDGQAVAWRSDDGGESWTSSDPAASDGGSLELDKLAYDGTTMVGIRQSWGIEGPPGLGGAVSSDDGVTWARWSIDGPAAEGLRWPGVFHAGGFFWIVSSRSFQAFQNQDSCYADVSRCGMSEPVLFRSPDGAAWSEIDLGAANLPPGFGIDAVIEHRGGIGLVGSAGQLSVWSGPPGADLPVGSWESPDPPETELVDGDAVLEIGVTYRYPLYIHCGMSFLASFNNTHWHLESGPPAEVEEGQEVLNPEWPIAQQTIFGFVTMVDSETVEYSIPSGEVIGVYRADDRRPRACN